MRYFDLIEVKQWKPHPETTDRYVGDDGVPETITPEEFSNQMRAEGWVHIGGGVYKDVWKKKGSRSVQLLIRGDDASSAMFETWHDYCKTRANKFLPKYGQVEKIHLPTGRPTEFIKVSMENLHPVRLNNPKSRLLNLILPAVYVHDTKEDPTRAALADAMKNGGVDAVLSSTSPLLQDVASAIDIGFAYADFATFYTTVTELFEIAKKHGWDIDLHDGNFMARPNGQLVIIDPWKEK